MEFPFVSAKGARRSGRVFERRKNQYRRRAGKRQNRVGLRTYPKTGDAVHRLFSYDDHPHAVGGALSRMLFGRRRFKRLCVVRFAALGAAHVRNISGAVRGALGRRSRTGGESGGIAVPRDGRLRRRHDLSGRSAPFAERVAESAGIFPEQIKGKGESRIAYGNAALRRGRSRMEPLPFRVRGD